MATGTVYSDALSTNSLPDAMRTIFSTLLEFTARPLLISDQPEFVEIWPEFGAKRGSTVTRTVYHQLPPAIGQLTQNADVVAGGLQDHQVSVTIGEYGYAEGVTEVLDVLAYHGPISSIIKSLLGPQMGLTMDTLARNAYWYGQNGQQAPMFKYYADGAIADRWHLGTSNTFTAAMVKDSAYRLGVRQVPTLSGKEPSFVALAHPAVINDLRSDSNWVNANLYAGSQRIFSGEDGSMHGVRFLKSTRHRVANGGTLKYQLTLAAGSYPIGSSSVVVTSGASNVTVGDEITLHATGDAVTAPNQASSTVSWTAPNGKDPVEETLQVASVNTGTQTITFTTKTMQSHNAGEFVTESYDIYPVTFLGGIPVLAKGVALAPEVRVALPTDKLRRLSYVGWYSLLDYGISRNWAYEVNEVTASQNVAPVYAI